MAMKAYECIGRFLMHVVANGFHRIRHCGLLSSGTKTETIARIRKLIALVAPVQTAHQPQPPDSTAATDQAPHPCPCCGDLIYTISSLTRSSPPRRQRSPPIVTH